jgi:hypothetical protein
MDLQSIVGFDNPENLCKHLVTRLSSNNLTTIQTQLMQIGFIVLNRGRESALDDNYHRIAINTGLKWLEENLTTYRKYFNVNYKGQVYPVKVISDMDRALYGRSKARYPLPNEKQLQGNVSGFYDKDYNKLFPDNLKIVKLSRDLIHKQKLNWNFRFDPEVHLESEKEILQDGFKSFHPETFIDSRGRMYYKGYQVNLMGNKKNLDCFSFDIDGENHPICMVDATGSGLQMLSVLSQSLSAVRKTNLASDKTIDVYQNIIDKFNERSHTQFSRKELKKTIMTFFYNQSSLIRESVIFKSEELNVLFEEILIEEFSDLVRVMNLVNMNYYPRALQTWKLPDGFVASCFEYQEERDFVNTPFGEFNITYKVNKPNFSSWRSLLPNIVQSIEAYIMREVLKSWSNICKNRPIVTKHDCFGVIERDIPLVKSIYHRKVAMMYKQNILPNIIKSLNGDSVEYTPISFIGNGANNVAYQIMSNGHNGLVREN